jgi:hypothetical protein
MINKNHICKFIFLNVVFFIYDTKCMNKKGNWFLQKWANDNIERLKAKKGVEYLEITSNDGNKIIITKKYPYFNEIKCLVFQNQLNLYNHYLLDRFSEQINFDLFKKGYNNQNLEFYFEATRLEKAKNYVIAFKNLFGKDPNQKQLNNCNFFK